MPCKSAISLHKDIWLAENSVAQLETPLCARQSVFRVAFKLGIPRRAAGVYFANIARGKGMVTGLRDSDAYSTLASAKRLALYEPTAAGIRPARGK